jgi:hypothetical protein
VSRLNRKPPHFPSLTSRLRVAIKGRPLTAKSPKPDRVEVASDTAAAILRAPAAPSPYAPSRRPARRPRPIADNREVQAGLILAATLLGWTAARRVRQARRPPV